MHARHIVTALAVLAAGTVAVAPASAAPKKPKPFKGTKSITDNTADPTGSATDGADCTSLLPEQAPQDVPFSLKVPGVGKLKISIDNKLDWALEIRDTKGVIIGSSDGSGPQDPEMVTVKTKKAGTYKLLACNLGGEPTVTMTYSWTPA